MAQLTRKSPTITINSLGLRGPEVSPAKHRYAVLAVGSSQGLGVGNQDDETWTARLEAALKAHGLDAVVLNGSSPGWGPWQHALFLRSYADSLHADLLLVMVSSGDLNFLPKALSEADKERLLEKSRRKKKLTRKLLELSPFLVFSLRKAEVLWLRTSRCVNASLAGIRRTFSPPPPSVDSTAPDEERVKGRIQRQERYWHDINAFSIASKRPVVFLVLNPTQQPIARELVRALRRLTSHNPWGRVVELDHRTLGFYSVDEAERRYLERFTFPNDSHANALYHEVMGRHVAPTVESLLLELTP